jgi:hypothetical protein
MSASDSDHSVSDGPELNERRSRPKLSSRKSSGTNIIQRDNPRIEIQKGDETFHPDDARAMSPRRNSEDLEEMAQSARKQLSQ